MVIFGKLHKIKILRFKHRFECRNIKCGELIDAKSGHNANNNLWNPKRNVIGNMGWFRNVLCSNHQPLRYCS